MHDVACPCGQVAGASLRFGLPVGVVGLELDVELLELFGLELCFGRPFSHRSPIEDGVAISGAVLIELRALN